MKNRETIYLNYAEALDSTYRTDKLKDLASIICPKVPALKAERVAIIVSTMFKDIKGTFNQLPPLAQNAVAETVHNWHGTYNQLMYVNKYFAGPRDIKDPKEHRNPELIYLFLLNAQIPLDLLEKLQKIVPQPKEDQIMYFDEEPYDKYTKMYFVEDEGLFVRNTAHAALENLNTLLTLAEDKKIRISAKTGRGTTATIKKIDSLLYEGDWFQDEETGEADKEIGPMQAFAWPLLLQGGGLAKAQGSLLQLTPAGRKALKQNLAEGMRNAWPRYQKNKLIDEFSRVTAIKGQRSNRGRTMTTPAKRRPAINMLLGDLEPGKWIDVDELFRQIKVNPIFSFKVVNYEWKLYLDDAHYGLLDYNDTWPLLQLRYLLVYLFEYCATMGLIDVAYKRPDWARDDFRSCWGADGLYSLSHCDGLQYIRINKLGAYVFEHTDEYIEEKSQEQLYSFEECDIVLAANTTLAPGQELFLEKIADQKEVDRWRLSTASLLNAIKDGQILSEIRTSMEAESSEEFSTSLQQLFDDIELRTTAFMDVGTTTLLECNPEFRKQVLTDKKLGKLCLPAGNKHLVIRPGKENLFAAALEKTGFIIGRN